jgi:hypothetical protein
VVRKEAQGKIEKAEKERKGKESMEWSKERKMKIRNKK